MVQPNGESQKAAGKKEALPKPISGKVPQGCKPRSDQAQQAPGSEKNGQPALETVLPMVFENRVENLVDGGVSHSAMHLIVKLVKEHLGVQNPQGRCQHTDLNAVNVSIKPCKSAAYRF